VPGQLSALDVAVRQLYETFAECRRRAELRNDFCAHCVSQHQADALVSTPVRDLEPALIQIFVADAISWTWGTPDDLWCYLPRVLELVAAGEFGRNDISGLFTAMRAGWSDWRYDQTDAVTGYLNALWRATIGGYWLPCKLDVIDLLEAAGDLGIPVDSFLHAWETDSSEPAALHLAWLIRHRPSRRGRWAAEWSQATNQWMRGPGSRRVLTSAVAVANTPEIADNLSGALGILDTWEDPSD
jgi:hypothetical protein